MKQWPSDLENIMNSPEAKELMKNKEKIKELSNSREIKEILEILKESGGKNIENAAQTAMAGDPSELSVLIDILQKNPEAAEAISQLKKHLSK